MKFYDENLNLTVENVSNNGQLRDAFKLGSNSMLGKLSQDPDADQQVFLSNQIDLDRLFYSPQTELVDIMAISDTVIQARIKRRSGFNLPNQKGSVVLGSYVTSAARIAMHKWFDICINSGGTLYYTDTDSIVFSLKKGEPLPFPFGNAYGQFKHEVEGEIRQFYSLGPKNYCIATEASNGSTSHMIKARGFYLKGEAAKAEVNLETFKMFIDQLLNKQKAAVKHVPQFRISCEKKTRRLFSEICVKKFANNTYNKRVYFTGPKCTPFTLPYGYSQEMLLSHLSPPNSTTSQLSS